ncbi:MAG: DMT family transporter [Sphaerochaetaceae bacterium]|nr:DMT family transporter [Sphaerochaetaceae bacterium]
MKLILAVFITLVFFALNSLLVKAALLNNYADPYTFTFLRIFFGALALLFLIYFKNRKIQISLKNNYISSVMLFLYTIFFSYAYISLDAGVGALILFAFVQLTIILYSLVKKEKLSTLKLIGILISFLGLVYLLYPNDNFAISSFHFFLMSLSGIAWGVYTILGKKSENPILNTSDNFIKASLIALLCFFIFLPKTSISLEGIALAFISGAITSALGYALWYKILPQLQTIISGVIQLLVPPIAIFLGVIFLDELLSTKLIISTIIILLGIMLCIMSKNKTI